MQARDRHEGYTPSLITLHWLTFLLIAVVYACIELRVLYPKGGEIREALKTWHFMLGLGVFLLVWVRLAARLFANSPPIVPAPPRWQLRVAHLSEFTIYVFMFVMPLLGWLSLSAENAPVPFFGLRLPALVAESESLAKQLKEVHELIGKAGYFLIGLHAAAALVHHYVQRDNTLVRMLPGRLKKS